MGYKTLLISISSLTALGGLGYSMFLFMKPSNLREELISQQLKIINKDEKELWKILAEKHKKSNSEPIKVGNKTIQKINGLTEITEANEEGIKKLQDKCNELLNKKLNDPKIELHRSEAKNWCIKESDLIKENIRSS